MSSPTKMIVSVYYAPTPELSEFLEANKDIYLPINGGASLKGKTSMMMDDCKTDNISHLNPILNELTPLYLIAKNLDLLPGDTANIGLCHYRRLLKRQDLEQIDNVDGIIAKPIPLGVCGIPTNVVTQYWLLHHAADLDMLGDALKDLNLLDEDLWQRWLNLKALYAPCNTFCFKREVFNMYCDDLFKTIFKLMPKIHLSDRDDYQKRVMAFLAERFTSYWCFSKQISGKLRFFEAELECHEQWKPSSAQDGRGMKNGKWIGDQSMTKI